LSLRVGFGFGIVRISTAKDFVKLLQPVTEHLGIRDLSSVSGRKCHPIIPFVLFQLSALRLAQTQIFQTPISAPDIHGIRNPKLGNQGAKSHPNYKSGQSDKPQSRKDDHNLHKQNPAKPCRLGFVDAQPSKFCIGEKHLGNDASQLPCRGRNAMARTPVLGRKDFGSDDKG
jgi:hypothetical protein